MKKLLTATPIMVLILFLCLGVVTYSQTKEAMQRALQDRTARRLKQEKILAAIPFDRVVLYALIAAEQNYAVKARLLPKVHEDDYYTVILNTAIRLAMADSGRITLPGLQEAAKQDSTKNKKDKESK